VAKSIKPPPGVPHVCYCFTPMRYAWHRREDYVASARLRDVPMAAARHLVLDWIRDWDRRTSDRVTHYVSISETVAGRIAESYGRPSRVIYPPVDTEFYTPAPVAREPFYVCVSALVPYKRIDVAIAACQRLGRRLLVIGDGPERNRLQRLAGPTVELAGWCSNETIRDQLRRARALLFPAYEDFGIVPLEAQACGTPVIAYGEGGARETVLEATPERPGTGLFFRPQTPESLAEAILQFEAHPQAFAPNLARRQAERFRVERFEAEMVSYLKEVAGAGRETRANHARVAMQGTAL
jgi:glycosyltransferase involved in cell wall biosynthesis